MVSYLEDLIIENFNISLSNVLSDIELVKNNLSSSNINVIFYLFGSVFFSLEAEDVDLLVIYTDNLEPPYIRDLFQKLKLNYYIDFYFMTLQEEQELNFIEVVKAKVI